MNNNGLTYQSFDHKKYDPFLHAGEIKKIRFVRIFN
jgi:hypothetical protein